MFAKWPVNAKKLFRLKFWKIFLFQIAWKTTSCERKKMYFVLMNIWEFLLNVRVSIGRNFNSQFHLPQRG